MNDHIPIELSVVIPVYGSESSLSVLADRLVSTLERIGRPYEIIFVEDASPDGSWNVLVDLQAKYPSSITVIQLMRNFGQHNAIMCGLRRARGRLIVTMDDDLQNPPEEIPRLIDAIEAQQLDVVYGQYEGKQHHAWRNLGSLVVNIFYRVVFRSSHTVTSFRIMPRKVVESILDYQLNFTFLDGLLAWNTTRIGTTPVRHEPRREGRSGYSIAKLLTLSFNLFTNFSLLPLQLVSLFGLSVAFIGFCVGGYYLVQRLLGQIAVPGYASIIIAVLILGGVQLMSLGIIGEYLGRLHLNVNRKPQYRERQVLGSAVTDRVMPAPTEAASPDAIDPFDARPGVTMDSHEISSRLDTNA